MEMAEGIRRRQRKENQSEADSEDSNRNSEGDLKAAEKKDWEKKNKNKIITRVVFGVAMIVGFLGVVYAGRAIVLYKPLIGVASAFDAFLSLSFSPHRPHPFYTL